MIKPRAGNVRIRIAITGVSGENRTANENNPANIEIPSQAAQKATSQGEIFSAPALL